MTIPPNSALPQALLRKRESNAAAFAPQPQPAPAAPANNVLPMQPGQIMDAPVQTQPVSAVPAAPAAPVAAAPAAPAAPQPDTAPALDLSAFLAPGQTMPAPAPEPAPVAAPQAYAAPGSSAEDVQNLRGQIEALTGMIGAMQQNQTAGQQPATPAALLDINPEEFTPEEIEKYGGSLPMIKKALANFASEMLEPALQQINARTIDPTELESLRGTVAQTQSTSFSNVLAAAVPDLQQLAVDPNFKAFLNQPIPNTGGSMTVGSVVSNAYKTQDAGTISRLVGEYRQQAGAAPVVPPQAAFHAPAPGPAPVAVAPTEAKGPILSWSKRAEAGSHFRKGLISREQLGQINAAYEAAMVEGRVDMNS